MYYISITVISMHLVIIHNLKKINWMATPPKGGHDTLLISSYGTKVHYFCIMMVMQFDKISD